MGNDRKVPPLAIAGAVTTGAVMAGGMILSEVIRNQIVTPTRAHTTLDTTVTITPRGTMVLPGVNHSWSPIMGLRTARSVYRLGPLPDQIDPKRTTGCEREFTRIQGPEEPAGTYGARFYTYQWFSAQEAGLLENIVYVQTPIGAAPAKIWQSPLYEPLDTWVIGVHGRAAVHEELLRMAAISASRGLPFMAMSYRNDLVGGPHTDGVSHMGETEWEDLDWAIRYAQHHGAKQVILLGASQGGSLIGYWMHQVKTNREALVSDPDRVIGIILDCPLIRGSLALEAVIQDSGVPAGIDRIISMAATGWMGVRGPRKVVSVDHMRTFKDSPWPILLYGALHDPMNKVDAALELAKEAHVSAMFNEMADHMEVYNEDVEGYTEVMAAWLEKVTGPQTVLPAPKALTSETPTYIPGEDLAHFQTEQIITSKDT